MSVAKVSEITVSSSKSFEDAIKVGIKRANKTLKNVKSAWVKEQKVTIEKGEIVNRFEGFFQEKFMLKCAIGGPKDIFVAMGGENGQIHIWHKFN